MAVSPDGAEIVYVANRQLYLRNLNELEARPIEGTEGNPSAPFFSPDGESVGFYSFNDNQLKKIAVRGGTPVTLTDAENPLGAPSWGRDDSIVWAQSGGVMRVSGNGGTAGVLVANSASGNLVRPQILPGGSYVLASLGNDQFEGQVVVHSLDTDEQTVLFPGFQPRYIPTGHLIYAIEDVLYAVPFDLASLEVTGGQIPVVEGVRPGMIQYAVSDSGSLVYVPGSGVIGTDRVLGLADRGGDVELLSVRPNAYSSPKVSPLGDRVAV